MAGEIQLNGTSFASESSGTITVNNGTLGSSVVFPTGVIKGVAFLAEVTNGDAGASSTSSTLRTLNTEIYAENCPTTITSNEFSFDETGTYLIQASAPAYKADGHILRISDDAGSSYIFTGSAGYNAVAAAVQTRSFVFGKVTIGSANITGGASQKDYGFWQIVDTSKTANGQGNNNGDTTTEQHLQVQIFRIA